MKHLLLAIALLFSPLLLRAKSPVANPQFHFAAASLQKNIPGLAIDGLFEAQRGDTEWRYSFWTRIEKTWVSEVRITLRDKNTSSCDIHVQVVRIEGGLLWSSAKLDPVATAEWTAKINELLLK